MTRDDGGGEESHGYCHCRTGAMTLMIRWHPTWFFLGGGENGVEW